MPGLFQMFWNLIKQLFLEMSQCRPLFRLFNTVFTTIESKQIADDWIRTANLGVGSDHFTNCAIATARSSSLVIVHVK